MFKLGDKVKIINTECAQGNSFCLEYGKRGCIGQIATIGYEGDLGGDRDSNSIFATLYDGCICFWDGKSKGTKHMIDLARKYNLNTVVVNY